MPGPGWTRLVSGRPAFRGEGAFPIAAYSEFMPPPRLGISPYGATAPGPFAEGDPWGWRVAEHEEAFELRPGLEQVAAAVVGALARLGRGEPAHGISRAKLAGNPYWPAALAGRAGSLRHERFVVLMPLALSRTQDDKGRAPLDPLRRQRAGPGAGLLARLLLRPRPREARRGRRSTSSAS